MKLFSILIILFSFSNANAQKEDAIWYFGDSIGVDFNSSKPVVLSNFKQSIPQGCASICTPKGRLLFFIDGLRGTIYDSTFQIMPHGKELNKVNYGSGESNVLIIPLPKSQSLYYIFTIRKNTTVFAYFNLYYSVVDMRLNNGKGDVINEKRNIPLMEFPASKITGTKHANGKDYWIVAHQLLTDSGSIYNYSDAIYAWQLTSNGLTNPVITRTGLPELYPNVGIGTIKISPDGKKIAYSIGTSRVIADFDASSGKISNLFSNIIGSIGGGLEFSSSSNLIYFINKKSNDKLGEIWQYDAKAKSKTEMLNSRKTVDSSLFRGGWSSSLKRSLDGKIYIYDGNNRLHVIHTPDSIGKSCRVEKDYVSLNKFGNLGCLPNTIASYYHIAQFDFEEGCINDTSHFKLITENKLDSVKWDFGDIASGLNNFSTKMNGIYHQYKNYGNYKVSLVSFIKGESDTFILVVYVNNPAPDFKAIDVCDKDSVKFNNQSSTSVGKLTYHWKFGDGQTSALSSPSHLYTIAGVSTTFNVSLKVKMANGCSDSISKQVTVNTNPSSDFNYTVNQNKVIFEPAESSNTFYKWWYGNGDSANRSSNEHTYTYENLSKKYNVCMMSTNAANCSSKTCKDINITVGLNTIKNAPKIKVYPNPASETITVEMDGSDKTEFNIQLINSMGQVVIERTAIQHLTFNIQHLSEGVYLLRVISDGKVWSQKVIVSFGGDINR